MNRHQWMIVMVLLVGMGVLMYDLVGYQPLWVDEGWSIAAAGQGTLIDVTEFVAADVHPPFYFQLLNVWETFTGDSILALRYLSVMIVLVSTALVYRMGRGLMSPYAGVLAATLFVLHDLIGVLGREVRQYPLTQLLAILVMVLYWRMWTADDKRERVVAFVIGGVVLLYTHYWGGFLLLALGLHALLTRMDRLWRYIVAFAVMGLLFLPWVPVVLDQVGGEAEGGLGHALPANREGFDILTFQLLGRPETLWLILLAVGAAGVYVYTEPRQSTWLKRLSVYNPGLMPALVVLVPVGVSFAINFAFSTLSFRALSMVVPAAMVLVGVAVAGFRAYERAVLTLIVVALSMSMTAARPAVRLPWPDVAEFVAAYTDDTDAVLIETDFDTYAYDYYLREQNPAINRLFTEVERRREFAGVLDIFVADLYEQLADVDGLWVTRYSSDIDLLPTLESAGWQRTASVLWETEVGVPVETWRYDRPTDAALTTFGDGLTLHRASAQATDNGVALSLLWSPEVTLDANYTISAFLLDADGTLVAQNDSYPLDGRTPTAGWSPDRLYFDGNTIPTPEVAAGTYTVGVRVYTFTDETFTEIAVQQPSHCADCNFYDVGTVTIGGGDG